MKNYTIVFHGATDNPIIIENVVRLTVHHNLIQFDTEHDTIYFNIYGIAFFGTETMSDMFASESIKD